MEVLLRHEAQVLEPFCDDVLYRASPDDSLEAWSALADVLLVPCRQGPAAGADTPDCVPSFSGDTSTLVQPDCTAQTDEATLSRSLDVVPFDLDDTLRVHGADHGEERRLNTTSAPAPSRFDPYGLPWTTRTFLAPLALDAEAVISAWEVAEDARCGYAAHGDDCRQPAIEAPPSGDANSRRSARALVVARKARAEVVPAAAWARLERRVPFARELLHNDLSIALRQCPPSLALQPHAMLLVAAPPLVSWRAAREAAAGSGLSRAARVQRYLCKRRSRSNKSIVRYHVRKTNAEARPRLNGRFIKEEGRSVGGVFLPVLCDLLLDGESPDEHDTLRMGRSHHAPDEF